MPPKPPADALRPGPRPGPVSVRIVWSVAVASCICAVLAAVMLMVGFHQREIAAARHEVQSLDAVLAEEAARTFQNVSLVLDGLAQDVLRDGIATPDDFKRLRGGPAAAETLRSRKAGLPQLDAITVVAADGQLVNFTRDLPLPAANLADREYFRVMRELRTDGAYLSEPVHNRGNGTLTTYVARRVTAPDGTFLGLFLGAFDVGYFERFYASLNLGPHLAVGLWREDGTLLSRVPAIPASAKVPVPKWLQNGGLRSGTYETPGDGGMPARLIAYRRIPGVEATVSVSMTRASALQDWYVQAAGAAAAAAAFVAAALLLAFLFTRQIRTHEALATAVAARERADAERDETEARLRQAQKMEAVGHLTGGIAHDFNNMLAIVVGSLDILGRKLERGEDGRRFADAAMEGAKRAAALTQRLLAFSRRQQLAPRVVEAADFVSGAAILVEKAIGKGVHFRVETAPGRWRVEVDESQLENALLNLALNARDATPDGGEIVLRTVNAKLAPEGDRPGGDHVVISVTDSGHGMDPETAARAVEPFFTTKAVGSGTGLGLSQVYGFANQSGGRLRIESEPGRGTTVSVLLPRTHARPEAARATDSVPRARNADETVLLVDDEESVRLTAAEMLRDLGYAVVHVSDPAAALDAVAERPDIALLLTDVVMPSLDGRALAAEARRRRPGLAVLYATGQSLGSVEPGSKVLPKPFDMRRLAEAVRSAIDAAPRAGQGLRRAVA